MLLEKIFEGKLPGHVDARNPCGLVNGVLNFDIDGSIHACHEGKRQQAFKLGSVSDDPEKVLYSSKSQSIAAQSVLDSNEICRSCAYIAYCNPCPANNFQARKEMAVIPGEDFQCKLMLKLGDWVFSKLAEDPKPLVEIWKRNKVRAVASQAKASCGRT